MVTVGRAEHVETSLGPRVKAIINAPQGLSLKGSTSFHLCFTDWAVKYDFFQANPATECLLLYWNVTPKIIINYFIYIILQTKISYFQKNIGHEILPFTPCCCWYINSVDCQIRHNSISVPAVPSEAPSVVDGRALSATEAMLFWSPVMPQSIKGYQVSKNMYTASSSQHTQTLYCV